MEGFFKKNETVAIIFIHTRTSTPDTNTTKWIADVLKASFRSHTASVEFAKNYYI